jgi:hypothetical protein
LGLPKQAKKEACVPQEREPYVAYRAEEKAAVENSASIFSYLSKEKTVDYGVEVDDIDEDKPEGWVEYLAPMEDLPYSSENHVTTLRPGEVLVGGMPKKTVKRAKARPPREAAHKRTILYNSVPSMPDEFDTQIQTFGTMSSAAATASVTQQIYSNSLLHTGDDFGASSATSNFLANVGRNYTKYRVTSYDIQVVFSSRATSDSHMTVLHSPITLGFSAGTSWQPESVTRDKSSFVLVPANTKSPCIVKHKSRFTLLSVVGNAEFRADKEYAGTLSTVGVPTDPTDLTYITFHTGLVTGTFTAGTCPQISVRLTQRVKFYDKRT